MRKWASISPCGIYRYTLGRSWDYREFILWVMLNPSTADAADDDQTVRKCIGFTKRWGFDGFEVGNLYAYRTRWPRELKAEGWLVGEDNLHVLRQMASRSAVRVAAWGATTMVKAETRAHTLSILRLLREYGPVHCIRTGDRGFPVHPLVQAYTDAPVLYTGDAIYEEKAA